MGINRRYLPKEVNHTITCPRYESILNSKRCEYYQDQGACTLTTEFMCIEWLKANKHVLPTNHPVFTPKQMSLLEGGSSELPLKTKPAYHSKAQPQVKNLSSPLPSHDPPVLQVISRGDIESFKALHVEICLHSEALGDIWLVPSYTQKDRKEISVEHAATLRMISDAFPGTTVTAFDRSPIESQPLAQDKEQQ